MTPQDLPYYLPKNPRDKLIFLAEILDIPRTMVINGGQTELEAMCGVIMYRHLDPHQRIDVFKLIRSLDGPLQGRLVQATTLPLVNPQWGIWSLTNEELTNDAKYHEFLDSVASYIGLTASGVAVKDLAKNVWSSRKIGKGGFVTIVIWAAVLFNQSELEKANAEISRRTPSMKTSRLY